MEARTFVDTIYRYDNNINLQDNPKEDDSILSLRPGLSARLNGKRASLDLYYQLGGEHYLQNNRLDALNHDLNAEVRLDHDGGRAILQERYQRTYDRAYTTVTQLVRRQDHLQRLRARWQPESIQVEGVFERFERRFESPYDLADYWSLSAGPEFSLSVTTSQQLIGDVQWERYRYFALDPRNGEAWSGRLGWAYNAQPSARIRLLAGYKRRDFNEGSLNDFSGAVGEGSFEWTSPNARTLVRLEGSSTENESVVEGTSGYYREYRQGATLSYQIRSRITGAFVEAWARQSYGNQTVSHEFTGRRRDDVQSNAFYLIYRPSESLSLTPGFLFQQRNSNVPRQSYDDHVFSLQARYEL